VTAFGRLLKERQVDPAGRRWLFVPYDQLSDATGPLSWEEPRTLGIVLIENPWKAARRPYHKQKLASEFDRSQHGRLVVFNWIRTLAWTARAALVLDMLRRAS